MGNVYTKSGALARRIYFGATTIWENLYYFLQKRVLADGGTFIENDVLISDDGASLILTPNAYKVGKLYSAKPNFGTGDFTVDRNSIATYVDEDGLIKTALANVPRIDWSTGEATLLVEPQGTNLITYGEAFDNVVWSKSNLTVLANVTSALDGAQSADKLIANTVSGLHRLTYNAGISTTGKRYISKIFAKKGEYNFCLVRFFVDAERIVITVNLTTGEVLENANDGTGGFEVISRGNGWFEIITYSTHQFNGSSFFVIDVRALPILTTGENSFTGDGDSGIYLWGAQLEQASTASSYIPTNGTTVTRLADNISVPTPAGVTSITETIDGVEQTPITTIPTTYSLPVGNINKVTML